MRSRSMVALCSLVALAAGAGGRSAQGRADSRPGLAVFPIWNSGSYGQDKENFDALQRGMAAMIISELAANPGARVVEREELQRLLEEQNLGASGRVDDATAAKVGKLVGARYVVTGTFIDFYGDFRVDLHLVNVETSEIMKVEKENMRRDHLFDIIRNVSQRLMKDASLPPVAWQPGGVAAILEGAQVERRELRLPRELAVDERPTVLVLDPESRSLFPLDVLRAFVDAGGAIVALGRDGEADVPEQMPAELLAGFVRHPAGARQLLVAVRAGFREGAARVETARARNEAASRSREIGALTRIGVAL